MSYEDAMNTILPSQGSRSAHITGHYGESRGNHGPHDGSDFNYQGGQAGINLTHPTIHSPVDAGPMNLPIVSFNFTRKIAHQCP